MATFSRKRPRRSTIAMQPAPAMEHGHQIKHSEDQSQELQVSVTSLTSRRRSPLPSPGKSRGTG
ncbi:hypothetical protein C5167_037845 [Papaver somniferum]|uniref:Uncharacterized protein n=1 Tax=Papaver somniferum TaxID=3469 RepID=A0A4Y7IBW3_PAPSO|nr:hypothetical protein C5167_037845 [Papaver somniferum]